MRTQKRFTPDLLDRFERIGRGTGTYQDYIPWHRVGRSDPASIGRSHLTMWRERQRELLSDCEWDGLHFSTMLTNVIDLREQHMLSLHDGRCELAQYDASLIGQHFPGTLAVAAWLKIKHPRVVGGGRSDHWRMTTDQVLVLETMDRQLELLAVSYKPDANGLSMRARALLRIEKEYWRHRGVKWLLITRDLFQRSVADTLRRSSPWALGSEVSPENIRAAVDVVQQRLGHTFTFTVNTLAQRLGDMDLAQRSFWQSVWSGAVTMDLRTGWRPHLPICLLSQDDFRELNPVAARRSSWI